MWVYQRTLLPVQFHPFLVSPIRRVYIDNTNQGASEVRVKELEKRLATKTTMEAELMKRCEALAATVDAHRQGERDANDRIMEIEQELEEQDQDSKVKIAGLENKIRELTKDNNILQRQATNLKTQMTSLKTMYVSLAHSQLETAPYSFPLDKTGPREKRKSFKDVLMQLVTRPPLLAPILFMRTIFSK